MTAGFGTGVTKGRKMRPAISILSESLGCSNEITSLEYKFFGAVVPIHPRVSEPKNLDITIRLSRDGTVRSMPASVSPVEALKAPYAILYWTTGSCLNNIGSDAPTSRGATLRARKGA